MELMFGVMGACRNDSGSEELISGVIQLPACLLACLLARLIPKHILVLKILLTMLLDWVILVGGRGRQRLSDESVHSSLLLLIFNSCRPEPGPSRSSQQKEERQHRNQLQNHRNRAKPYIFPRPRPNFVLGFFLAQPSQVKPSVVRQLAQSRARDDDEGRGPNDRDKVER